MLLVKGDVPLVLGQHGDFFDGALIIHGETSLIGWPTGQESLAGMTLERVDTSQKPVQ
jgi:hypothetical protein